MAVRKTKKSVRRKVTTKPATMKIHPSQKRISDSLGDKMFVRWCEEHKADTGYTGLAKEFGFSRKAMRDYAKRKKWEQAYLKYRAKSQKKVQSDLVGRHAEKMRYARELADAARDSLYEDMPDPDDPEKTIRKLKTPASINESVTADKYEDELADKFPDRGDESTVTATEEEVALFVSALESLGKEGLKAMGKLIVEKAKSLEKERPTEQTQ